VEAAVIGSCWIVPTWGYSGKFAGEKSRLLKYKNVGAASRGGEPTFSRLRGSRLIDRKNLKTVGRRRLAAARMAAQHFSTKLRQYKI